MRTLRDRMVHPSSPQRHAQPATPGRPVTLGDLAAGEPARALERIRRHAKEFPNGILTEEREAIAINALVSLGRYPEATKRASAFRARYPQSLMTHVVDAAMVAVPKD